MISIFGSSVIFLALTFSVIGIGILLFSRFFNKKNGFSKGIYKSLNCGKGSFDSKKNIKKNLIYVKKKII